jgi:F0F1-type ATP synthase membrane subunit b/b'
MTDKPKTMGEQLPDLLRERYQLEARVNDANKGANEIRAKCKKRLEQLEKEIRDCALTPNQEVMGV